MTNSQTNPDPLAADDAIVAEAGKEIPLAIARWGSVEGSYVLARLAPALRAIADKRGRALRETIEMLQLRGKGCPSCDARLARIREILGGE